MNIITYHRNASLFSGVQVRLDGIRLNIDKSLEVEDKSADFEIGYAGSGPSQLALAILMKFTDNENARRLMHQFKFEYLTDKDHQDHNNGTLVIDIPKWINDNTPDEVTS